MTCIVCRVTEPLEVGLESMAKIIYSTIAPEALLIFNAFVAVWAIHLIVFKGILQGDLKLGLIVKQICIFTLVATLLRQRPMLWDLIYVPLKEFIQAMTKTILSIGAKDISVSSSSGYVGAIDGIFQQMGYLGSSLKWSPSYIIGSLIMVFLYLGVAGMAVCYVLDFVFTVFWISSFSPLLLISLAFDSTRGRAINAFNGLLGSAFTIFFSVAAMTATVVLYQELFLVVAPNGNEVADKSNFAFTADWAALIILGILAWYQQGNARTLASTIAGVSHSPALAMVASGAMAMVGSAAVAMGFGGASKVLGAGVNIAKSGASKAWEAFKNNRAKS